MKKNKYLKYYIFFFIIYFTQGFSAIPSQNLFYLLKDSFHLTVSQIAYLGVLIHVPWVIKFVYGFISDAWPLFGYRRKSYLIICYILVLLSCLYVFYFGLTIISLIIVELILAFAIAFSDVVTDGVACQVGQKYNISGKTQSVQWGASSLAALIVGLGGGLLAEYLHYRYAFLILFGFVFLSLIFFIFSYKEDKVKKSMKQQCLASIVKAFRCKQLWISICFLFFLWTTPGFGTALMFLQRDHLQLSKIFIGVLGSVGSAFGMIGAAIYFKMCNRVNIKKLLYYTISIGSITTLCYLYYPNALVALIYTALFSITGMISHLCVMDFCVKIVPRYAEAISFALIMSVLNLGGMFSEAIGGWLYPIVGLHCLIIISAITTAMCLIFIPFLKIKKCLTPCK